MVRGPIQVRIVGGRFSLRDSLSIAAIVIAVVGTSLSFWQISQQRDFYRKSMRPILVINRNLDTGMGTPGLFLMNGGSGTALIEKMTLYIDGKEIKGAQSLPWLEIERRLSLGEDWRHTWYDENQPIIANSGLLPIIVIPEKGTTQGALLNLIKHLGIEIRYSSIWGEHFTVTENLPKGRLSSSKH